METYWTALPSTYQMKVRKIAREHIVDTHTVMRNLEGYLKDEIIKAYHSHNGFISMRELEALIDNIAQPTIKKGVKQNGIRE